MIRPALPLALIAVLSRPALANNEMVLPPMPDGTVAFVMPSGNVGCTYIPAGGTAVYATLTGREELHCTRVEPTYRVVVMEQHRGGHRPMAPGEVPGLSAAPVLPYGTFWQTGAFTCLSAQSGLVCTNGSGAGLRMSRSEVVTW